VLDDDVASLAAGDALAAAATGLAGSGGGPGPRAGTIAGSARTGTGDGGALVAAGRHGGPGDREGDLDIGTTGPAWLRAQRSLAAALVTGATRLDDIASIQRAVLIRLELWFIQRSRSEAITSRRVIERAAEALSDHPPAG
jgi:hypothetical protein